MHSDDVASEPTFKWENGRLIIEIDATIRVPIEIEPIVASAASGIQLTRRESQVLLELLKSKSNKEIAAAVNISERTVKFHVSALLAKFGMRGRMELARLFPNGLQSK